MSTDESTTETETEETEEVAAPELPDRPAGVSNEEWKEFRTEFAAFAADVRKGLTARRPAAPKPAQEIAKPSKKPAPKAEEAVEEKQTEKKRKSRGYWG